MIYILFIGILILFFISFFLFKKNILNPSVILCSVFLVSLFFSILNVEHWKIDFHLNSTILILITIIIFILGNIFADFLPSKTLLLPKKEIEYIFSLKVLSFFCILFIGLLYKYFQETYQLSLIGGNPGGYAKMLIYVRDAKLHYFRVSNFMRISYYFSKATSYVYLFIFSKIVIYQKFRYRYFLLLVPTIIYILFIILGGGRADIIYLIIYFFTVFFILYQKKYKMTFKRTRKILFYGILSLVSFFIIFSLAGLLTGKTQRRSLFEMISIYTGSSLPAFDVYMQSTKIPNKYFGEHTLFTIHKILRVIGYNKIPQLYPHYEFIYFNTSIRTNIYTAIRRYYQDFGLIGLFIIVFLLGVFYGKFFKTISNKRVDSFKIILYASSCYPIFMFSIDDIFFRDLFPLTFVYNFIALGIVYYSLHRQCKNK